MGLRIYVNENAVVSILVFSDCDSYTCVHTIVATFDVTFNLLVVLKVFLTLCYGKFLTQIN